MVVPWGFVRSKSSERLAMREKAHHLQTRAHQPSQNNFFNYQTLRKTTQA